MKKIILFYSILQVFYFSSSLAQSSFSLHSKVIYKRYETDKLNAPNRKAVLILFTDNTFINFGNYDGISEKPNTIWYTAGRWLGSKEIFMCKSYAEIQDPEQLLSELKTSYRSILSPVNVTIDSEFKQVVYSDYIFSISKSGAKDKVKNLDYDEIKQ